MRVMTLETMICLIDLDPYVTLTKLSHRNSKIYDTFDFALAQE